MTTTIAKPVRKVRKPRTTQPKPVEQHPLADLIPDPIYAATYIHRKVNGMDDFAVIDLALAQGLNILVEGPTGSGKTHFFRAYCAARRIPFYAISSTSGKTWQDLAGDHYPMDNNPNAFEWRYGPLARLAKHGGLVIFNEIGFLPAKIASGAFQMLRERILEIPERQEVIEVHPQCIIGADTNPDYKGTQELNAALRNRFGIKLDWDYSDDVESSLVKSASLRDLAKKIRAREKAQDFDTPTPTNLLMEFERLALTASFDFAVANFVNSYNTDERPSVKQLFDTSFGQNIRKDLFPPAPVKVEVEDDDFNDWALTDDNGDLI